MKILIMRSYMLVIVMTATLIFSFSSQAAAFFCGAGCDQGSTETTKTAADNDGVSERVTTYTMDNGEVVTSTRTFNSRTNSETVTDSNGKSVTNYYGGGGGGGTTAALSGTRAETAATMSGSSAGKSTEQLKAMIENLQKRVAALTKLIQEKNEMKNTNKTKSGGGASVSAEARRITKNIGVGAKGAQVTSLQQCLSDLGYFDEADMDPSFGPKTRQAVKQFQAAEGIASSGNEWTTGYGYVGPKTRNKLNNKCGSAAVPPSPKPDSPYTSGFSASPTSGEAPLEVEFESNFNMWMVKPSIYYGDGDSELIERCYAPNDACSKPGVNTHVYEEAGTYKVVVKDDNEVYHRKTITVTE